MSGKPSNTKQASLEVTKKYTWSRLVQLCLIKFQNGQSFDEVGKWLAKESRRKVLK